MYAQTDWCSRDIPRNISYRNSRECDLSYYLCQILMQNHWRNMKERTQTCKTYRKSFSSHLILGYLMPAGEKPCKCTFYKKCDRRSILLNRCTRLHAEEKQFKSIECGKCFNDCSCLTKHMIIDPRRRCMNARNITMPL